MKTITLSCLTICVAAVLVVESFNPEQLRDQQVHKRSKRGFKMGASDRFSHGYGKRSDSSQMLEDEIGNTKWYMLAEDLATLLRTNPKLTSLFVEKYIDLDGDGIITQNEIMENGFR